MRAGAYCAHPRIPDRWVLRYMRICPDQVVSLKRDSSVQVPKQAWYSFVDLLQQFMSVRLSEENLVQARIRCLSFCIVSLEQEHWSVGDN
ncbi:hypothetical protein TNCV_3334831 [Trichonephila clavipes]|nr:hypothetical protein TNCV_3334831 [Trichonephila clavipes]